MSTAVLFDGAFFLKRHAAIYGSGLDARKVAKDVFAIALKHLEGRRPEDPRRDLYRIFFYDCPPLTKRAHNPVTGKAIDFSKTPTAHFRTDLHRELIHIRKVALRLGHLADRQAHWSISRTATKAILAGKMSVDDLSETDVSYDVSQKGVDMRIGLDIASLAYKKQVDQIVLIAGDSDFVPAAKLARREGIDFILDPMWRSVRAELYEHIDGLRSVSPKPQGRHR